MGIIFPILVSLCMILFIVSLRSWRNEIKRHAESRKRAQVWRDKAEEDAVYQTYRRAS